MDDVVAADVRPAPGANRIQLFIKCSGATSVVLVNGDNAVVRIRTLDDVVNDDTWERLELVGLPLSLIHI